MTRFFRGLQWALPLAMAAVFACSSDRRGGDDDDDDDGNTGFFASSSTSSGNAGTGAGSGTGAGTGEGAGSGEGGGFGEGGGDSSGSGSGSNKEAQCEAYGQLAVDCCTSDPEFCPLEPDGWEQLCLNGYDQCSAVFDCIVAQGCSDGDCPTLEDGCN